MSHPKMAVFSVEMPDPSDKVKMEAFQNFMNEVNDAMEDHIQALAKIYNVSYGCAADIAYLRTRSRWTEEAEMELRRRDRFNLPMPNMCEWPISGRPLSEG